MYAYLKTNIGLFRVGYYDVGDATDRIDIPSQTLSGDTDEFSITVNPTLNIDHNSSHINITESRVNDFVIYGKSGASYDVVYSNNKFVISGTNITLGELYSGDSVYIGTIFYIGTSAYGYGTYNVNISNIVRYNWYDVNITECKGTQFGYTVRTWLQSFNPTTKTVTLFPITSIIKDIFDNATIVKEDPYNKGGISSSGGGSGTFGGGSTIFGGNTDKIDIPDLPSLSAVDTGFITLFNPTLSQLNSLASYMWSDVFSLDTFKKLYADPMDCILGLSIVPVQPTSGGTGTVKIGNISTDVTMNKASSQYVSVDCGTVEVKEYWGGYLDYSPYTKCEIYLPYVGVHEISVDDIMNKSVHIVYHVDILSGACNAYVKCGDSVLYTFIGQCSSSIPISGNDWTNTINGVLSIAGNIGSLVASGGASAPTELPSMAQNAVNALKPNVEKSGAMSGTGGMLGIQKPYIILTRPNQALPENQNKYTGYPSFITMNLGECSGYTEIETIRLENMTCTDDELTEIETLLKQGVVF